MKESKKKDLILGVFCICFAAFIFYTCMGMPQTEYEGDPGPQLLPMVGSVLMAVFGIAIVVHPDKDGEAVLTLSQWKSVGKLFSVYVLMALLLWLFGFTVTVPVILFITSFMLSKLSAKSATVTKRLLISAIFAIVGGAVIYLLYIVALGASLPKGLVWQMLK